MSRGTIARAAALTLVVALLAGSAPTTAQEAGSSATTTRSFDVRAGGLATGMYLEVSRPLTLPFDPLVPVSFAAAEGNIDDNTGETTAFGSALYPGDILSSAAGLIGLVGFPIGGTVLPDDHPISQLYASIPGLVPPWPFEARASHPDNPGERVDLFSEVARSVLPLPVPAVIDGLVQDANAAEGFAGSSATLGRVQVNTPLGAIPGIDQVLMLLNPILRPLLGAVDPLTGFLLDVGGLSSSFNATANNTTAEVIATTKISTMALVGGLLQLGDVSAMSHLRSDGRTVEVVQQGYDIGAVTLAGVAVAIDDEGVHVVDTRIPLGSFGVLEGLLNQLLDSIEQAGIHIELPKLTEAGASRGVQLLELSVRAKNPSIPFALPEGNAQLTIRVGEIGARLETFPRPAAPAPAPAEPSSGAPSPTLALPAAAAPLGGAGSGQLATGPSAAPSGSPGSEPAPLNASQVAALEVGDLTHTLLAISGAAALAATFGWRRRTGRLP